MWVDHLRSHEAELDELLDGGLVVMHPFVVGEIACGNMADRASILELLCALPSAVVADDDEVFGFIESHGLHGKGVGWVDVHLLASAKLTQGVTLWTRDRNLQAAAELLGLAYRHATSH